VTADSGATSQHSDHRSPAVGGMKSSASRRCSSAVANQPQHRAAVADEIGVQRAGISNFSPMDGASVIVGSRRPEAICAVIVEPVWVLTKRLDS
jgi:hypothetical protein